MIIVMKQSAIPVLLALAVSFCACALGQTGRRQDTPIVAATYNIRMNTPRDSINAWPNRAQWVRELIRFHEWDIFGTQEGFKGQLDDLAKMEEYAWIGVGRDDGKEEGEHSAIFYRRDRFELLDKGDFWLSQTPGRPSLGWDAPSNIRICSWGRFCDRLTRRELYFFCAHYDHIGRQARLESSKLIVQKIGEITGGAPAILVGDMNSTPDTDAYAVLDGALRDARKAVDNPYGPEGTYGGFIAGQRPIADRIDYLFTTPGVKILKYGVLTDFREGLFYSDHLPVMVKMVIE